MSNSIEATINEIMGDDDLCKIIEDPVFFAQMILDIVPRVYQEFMLRSKSKQKVVRAGRRAGKTLAMIIHILWYAYVNKNSKQLVVAPVGTQVDEIFIELRRLISESPFLQGIIVRDKQYPQLIKFNNGSIIKGLSAGTSSSRGAKSTRGQGADWLYLDEADYLSEEDIHSIMGVTLEDSEIGVWSASTPTGAKELFYNWCKNSSETYTVNNYEDLDYIHTEQEGNGWAEFHFPAMCSPNWDKELEAKLKTRFTENAYAREVLAEFGEKEAGVYRNDHIKKAYKEFEYTYADMASRDPLPHHQRIMGIDWDKHGANTQIVISEYIPDINKIAVVHRTEIPKSEFAYTHAVNVACSLFHDWNCDFLYCDQGHGELQAELLKSQLGASKVSECAFNKSVEIIDPADKKKKKKELKHFMVTETQILLENTQVIFPKDATDLISQFEEYEVVRFSSNGKPVYSDTNEHIHDAVCLTLYGFNEEYPEITKILENIRFARKIKFVNKNINHVRETEKIFGKDFKDKDKDLSDESEYVKRMKSIEYGRASGMTGRGFRSWGKRGTKNSSFSDRSF